jgi:hypothetical protein
MTLSIKTLLTKSTVCTHTCGEKFGLCFGISSAKGNKNPKYKEFN